MDQNPADRRSTLTLLALLLVAFAVGGGGSRFGLANLVVQLTAIAVLAFHRGAFLRFWHDSSPLLRLLIAATFALPMLQIVPLPPDLWSALPGRNLVARSLELVGSSGWMPFSIDPRRTLLALTALITPLAVLIAGWTLPRSRLIAFGWLVVVLGLATTLLGAVQVGATGSDATIFGSRQPGAVLLGTFANRNSTGLFLGFALSLAVLLPDPKPHRAVVIGRLAVGALLLLAIIVTKSRTALALASIPVALGGIKALWWALRQPRISPDTRSNARPIFLVLGAIAFVTFGASSLFVAAPGRIGETLERFEARDDPRRFIWDDASYTVARYWPAGAGTGTFDEVFQVDESLENLTSRRAGRAHNDYIELAIEAGFAGLALAALWLVFIAWLSWRVRTSSHRWTAWAGSTFLFAIALQSITDYPLRNQTMLAFAGLALLLLVRIAADSRGARR